jgi:hypothetical protein
MSAYPNKASLLGFIIILATIYTSIVSAQTPVAVNRGTVKPESMRETKETVVERKAVLPATGTDTAPGPEAAGLHPGAEDSDSARADADTTVKGEMADAGRGPTARNDTTSPQTTSSDEWQFQFSPYFWLASLHGTGGVGNRTAEVDVSFGDIFDSLKFALMGVFEARKGKLVLRTDMEYVSVEDERATPGPLFSDVNAKFKTFIFDPEVGYRVYDDPAKAAYVDVLGGIRVWHVSTELDFGAGILPATRVEGSRNWVDAIVGLRGSTAVSKKLFVTGKFDLGGGGSKFTYQLFGGGGYNINQKVALIFGYRVLDVNYDKNNFIYDMNQRGPIMGIGFKF